MNSSSSPAIEPDSPDIVRQLDNVQGMVDALTCVRWKRHQLFTKYEYGAQGRPKFGISLGLLVDCLNTFSSPGHSNTIEIKYPGPDMELLLKSVDTLNACIYSEIRTRIPETVTWDYNFEQAGSAPLTFTVKIDFMYYTKTGLLLAFHCDTEVSYGYKYKFLKATTANIPGNVVRENRGSKLTIGRGGMLKVQHLVSVAKSLAPQVQSAGYQPPSRIAYLYRIICEA